MERTEHMAVNKITHSWNEGYTGLIFTGSQRQPTLVEVRNYCVAQHIPLEGVYIAAVRLGGEWHRRRMQRALKSLSLAKTAPSAERPLYSTLTSAPSATSGGIADKEDCDT